MACILRRYHKTNYQKYFNRLYSINIVSTRRKSWPFFVTPQIVFLLKNLDEGQRVCGPAAIHHQKEDQAGTLRGFSLSQNRCCAMALMNVADSSAISPLTITPSINTDSADVSSGNFLKK